MEYDDVLTRNDDGELSVRTVSSSGDTGVNPNDVYTRDENGKLCIRITGSGGGSVDETKVIVLSDTIPTADADSLGKFYCYKGETNASYTHGYIYECVAGTPTYTGTVSFEAATTSGTTVTCSGDDFANFLTEDGADPTQIVSGTMTYDVGADGWRLVGKDAEDNTVTTFLEYTQDYLDHGFVFTGVPVNDDVIAFTCTVEEVSTYSWERVDVQPVAKLGRYLSGWNCATGLAMTNPQESPYEYTTGDYFIVGVVATGGASNYKPNGSSYTIGVASTTVETEVVNVNDTYLYDGTGWTLLKTGSAVTSVNGQIGDVNIKSINGNSLMGSGNLELSTYLTYPAGWTTDSTTKALCDDIAADTSAVAGKAYLGEVTCSDLPASMANAEIVVEIMAGTTANDKVIVLTCSSGNTAPYKWQYTYWNNGTDVSGWVTFGNTLPSQTGNAGKFLQTNGTDVSWATAAQVSQPATMPVLTVANWTLNAYTNKYEQTVNVTGVTIDSVVYVSPIPTDANEYAECNTMGIGQSAGTLTFQCDVVPSNDLTVNVVLLS